MIQTEKGREGEIEKRRKRRGWKVKGEGEEKTEMHRKKGTRKLCNTAGLACEFTVFFPHDSLKLTEA